MKINFRTILDNLMVIIVRNPVEILISVAFFILSSLTYENILDMKIYGENLFLAPLIFANTFILNKLYPRGYKRFIYFLSALLIAIPFIVDAEHWIFSGAYPATLAIAAAGIAVYKNLRSNEHFVKDILVFTRELIYSIIIATAVFLVLMAIVFSAIYLFDLFKENSKDFAYYISCSCFIILAPVTFLYLHAGFENRDEFRVSKIFEFIINYILTPALIIYTVILYLYIAKITITWSLPKGNLAYMVFAFIISAIVIKAIIPLLSKRLFSGFFNSFSLIAIPPLVLFWIGAIYRIKQYGYTEERVYLLVCGAIMTFTVILFLTKKYDKYLFVGYISIVLLALSSYIPPISAKNIGIRSQTAQFKSIVSELKMIGTDGKLSAPPRILTDSVSKAKFDRMYDINRYLDRHSHEISIKEITGYENASDMRTEFSKWFTYQSYNRRSIRSKSGEFSLAGFSKLNVDVSFSIVKDSMLILNSGGDIICRAPRSYIDSVFAARLQAIIAQKTIIPAGDLPKESGMGQPAQPSDSLLYLDLNNYRIVFSEVNFNKEKKVSNAHIKALLIR
jgi:hypothetical protein